MRVQAQREKSLPHPGSSPIGTLGQAKPWVLSSGGSIANLKAPIPGPGAAGDAGLEPLTRTANRLPGGCEALERCSQAAGGLRRRCNGAAWLLLDRGCLEAGDDAK